MINKSDLSAGLVVQLVDDRNIFRDREDYEKMQSLDFRVTIRQISSGANWFNTEELIDSDGGYRWRFVTQHIESIDKDGMIVIALND